MKATWIKSSITSCVAPLRMSHDSGQYVCPSFPLSVPLFVCPSICSFLPPSLSPSLHPSVGFEASMSGFWIKSSTRSCVVPLRTNHDSGQYVCLSILPSLLYLPLSVRPSVPSLSPSLAPSVYPPGGFEASMSAFWIKSSTRSCVVPLRTNQCVYPSLPLSIRPLMPLSFHSSLPLSVRQSDLKQAYLDFEGDMDQHLVLHY